MTKHFVFATNSEAEKIIENSRVIASNLYQRDNHYIFICGVGKLAQENFLSYIQSKYVDIRCDSMINLGIAGACNDSLIFEKIYKIKTVTREKIVINLSKNEPEKVLYTSLVPVWEKEKKLNYAHQAYDLIDMEGYFLAKICREYGLNIDLYKLVSDYCQRENKQIFREKLPHFAELLLDFYKQLII